MKADQIIRILFLLTGLFVLYKIVKGLLSSTIRPPDPVQMEIEEIRRKQEATLRQIQEFQKFQVLLKYGAFIVDLKPGDALTLRRRLEKALEKIWRVGHEY